MFEMKANSSFGNASRLNDATCGHQFNQTNRKRDRKAFVSFKSLKYAIGKAFSSRVGATVFSDVTGV